MPSLLHEAELGFDVAFSGPGTVVVLQFKLGVELSRFRPSPPTQAIPLLERPFWRFPVDLNAPQIQRLVEFENARAEVYYVAPRFSSWAAYDRAFQDQVVLEKSLLVTPAEIARGAQAQSGPTSVHRILYDRSRRYVCSEPTPIEEHKPRDLVERIGKRARDPNRSLEGQIAYLFERPAATELPLVRQRPASNGSSLVRGVPSTPWRRSSALRRGARVHSFCS